MTVVLNSLRRSKELIRIFRTKLVDERSIEGAAFFSMRNIKDFVTVIYIYIRLK